LLVDTRLNHSTFEICPFNPKDQRMSARRRTVAAASTLAALSLVLAACGGDDEPEKSDSSSEPTDSVSTANALTLSGQWPLTGERLEGDLPQHPVYVVKIDNTSSSAPQLGLDQADMVVEELVEGGLTRLAAFYYENTPDIVGPVRSMRATDIGIVSPVDAVLVAAGGADPTKRRIAQAHIDTVGFDDPNMQRDESRSMPYNLFAHLANISKDPASGWGPPSTTYFKFGDPDLAGAATIGKITAEFSGAHTTDWVYQNGTWVRTNSNAQAGHDYPVDNVLILRVREGDAGYKDPAGNPVPETLFYGKGDAVLIVGDKALPIRWSKKDRSSDLELTTKSGDPVTVPAGHTFMELVPKDGGQVTLSR
jgi:hypothetical protein